MLGLEFRCSSDEHFLMCCTRILHPSDVVLPPQIVDVMMPGSNVIGVLRIESSEKSPDNRLIVKPHHINEGSLPFVIIELGATKSVEGFNNILAKCVELGAF